MAADLTRRHRDIQEEHHVKTEAEIGLLCLHIKDPKPPPEAGRGYKDFPLESSEGAWP